MSISQLQMQEIIRDACESAIDPALVSASLSPIENYMIGPPTNPDRRQVCICGGDLDDITTSEGTAFIIQIQLPGEPNVDPYRSAIWPALRKAMDPSIIGFTERGMTAVPLNPGEDPDYMGSAVIYVDVRFRRDLDDSQFDDEDWED